MRFVTASTSIAALATALLAAAPAYAADAATTQAPAAAPDGAAPDGGSDQNAITVSARHRDEKLGDVPLAISAVSGQELATEHLDRVADYTLKIPNFAALQQNTRVSGLYVRGLGGNASNDGAEGGVGLIVDGVFFTHVGFSWLDFVDLEGIEVVRGPQGTLLGKNTTIGAVIVTTAKPSFTPSLTTSATYGENGLWQLRANATGALIDDKLAARLTFATDQGGGWIPNAVDGIKYLNNNRWSVRGQLLFTPVAGVSSRLIAEHYETHEYNNFYPPVSDVNDNLKTDNSIFTTAANPTGARNSWTAKLEKAFGYTPNLNAPYDANLDTQNRLASRTDGVSNELNVDLGSTARLTAVSAWRRLYFRPANDSDYSPYPIVRAGYDLDVDQYSQEVRVASTQPGFLDWTAGLYYLHEDLESNLRTIFYSDATAFELSPALPSSVLNGTEYDRDGHLHIDSLAGFAHVIAHLTKAFSVTTGLRYTDETKRMTVLGGGFGGADLSADPAADQNNRNALYASLGGTAAGTNGSYQLDSRVNTGSFSWLVNPAYKVNENVLLYASAAYGAKSGAANTSATLSQAAVALTRPEKSLDFEGGIKSTWADGKVTANVNFYNNTISDYQGTQVDSSNPTFGTYLANVGKVRLRGVELETSLHPIPVLSIDFNTAYNDARYLSYDTAPAPVEYQAYLATVQGVSAAATTLNLTGQQIVNAPKWTVQGGVSLDQPLSNGLRLTGYANTTWKSSIAYINPLSIYGWQPSYAVVNAGIGIKSTDHGWGVNLWSKNLFNKFYAVAYAAATGTAPTYEILGDRRSYGITLTKKF
jgi:iron complex outermembrane receptor protein